MTDELREYLWSDEYREWRKDNRQAFLGFRLGKGLFAELKTDDDHPDSTGSGMACEEEYEKFGLSAQFIESPW